jgi:RNase P subunit RPR2
MACGHRFLNQKESAMSCPACTSTRLTSIQIRLAPDEDHTFASCQACEWKGWFKEGADVPPGQGPVPGQRTPVLRGLGRVGTDPG